VLYGCDDCFNSFIYLAVLVVQTIQWLGDDKFEGPIVLDECHRCKNYDANGDGGSKIGKAVVLLQKRLPKARVLYCSATGVTEVANMAFMDRLGLWGPSTPFPEFQVRATEVLAALVLNSCS
jgi:hypothetical protein